MTSPHPFDTIVLTAANESQAQSYEAQLEMRRELDLLPQQSRCLVVADPGGQRVGSGASTLAVLIKLLEEDARENQTENTCFQGQRILIAHSGGDARRLPAYAAQGKIFLPLPCDVPLANQPPWRRFPASLFDLLLQRLSLLPCPTEGQIVVCSGDVLLTFDAAGADVDTTDGICGLGFAAAPGVGQNHGVYITPNPSIGGPVTGFLQKPNLEEMEEQSALDLTGRVLVDTGVFCLAPSAARALLKASGVDCSRKGVPVGPGLYQDALSQRVKLVDFYQEIALALPRTTTKEQYLKGIERPGQTRESKASLGLFFDKLHQAALPFEVAAVPDGEFFHVGTSRDLLTKFTQPSRTTRSWSSHGAWRCAPQALDFASRIEHETGSKPILFNVQGTIEQLDICGPAYIEHCDFSLPEPFRLGGDNIVVGWHPNFTPPFSELPPGIGLVFLPLQKGTSPLPLLFGINDDNKQPWESGNCHFLNANLARLTEAGISPEVLWPTEGERSVWTAQLWLRENNAAALPYLLAAAGVTEISQDKQRAAAQQLLALWQDHDRLCWADLIRDADTPALLRQRQRLTNDFECRRIFDDLLHYDDFPAQEAVQRLAKTNDDQISRSTLTKIQSWHENQAQQSISNNGLSSELKFRQSLTQARLWNAAAFIADSLPATIRGNQSFDAQHYDDFALSAVARAVESSVDLAHEPRPAAIQADQVVWVTAPARIDFAGGWSDTPPICFERGGLVLNAAVTINHQYPVQVVAKLNEENCIRLTSIDLGKQEIYYDAEHINKAPDLAQWSSLAKAALVLSGMVPDARQSTNRTLKQWLEVLGGGLDLTLFSGLPKGSGMGTSSILGAATLACLAKVRGQELTHAELIAQTSLLEQRMTSGGGWQDQIGGIVPGVKLIRTTAGLSQAPALQWSVFGAPGHGGRFSSGLEGTPDLLSRRMLLYFTGQKRLAKNILQNVVKRYLAREPELLRLIERLKQGAHDAKLALEANDLAAFAHHVSQYWELKKAVDPGSTNAQVEAIIERVRPFTSGYSLCGAGGGGFMLIIARDEQAADAIRRELQENPPNVHARFFHFAIDNQGLAVTTL